MAKITIELENGQITEYEVHEFVAEALETLASNSCMEHHVVVYAKES